MSTAPTLPGVSLLAGQISARVIAVRVAPLIAAFPIWFTLMAALDIIVIWAVMTHGREMKSGY
jgi:hypothetical protein